MSNDFSRKCRDKVNVSFRQLKQILIGNPRYSNCREWSRFAILERAIEALESRRGATESYQTKIPDVDRSMLDNKQLCQLYRTRLNTGFDQLRAELGLVKGVDLSDCRLFSRNGILRAACRVLQPEFEQQSPPVKRKRDAESDKQSPTKLARLDDSGYNSPTATISPNATQLQYIYMVNYLRARAALTVAAVQENQTQQLWRPW